MAARNAKTIDLAAFRQRGGKNAWGAKILRWRGAHFAARYRGRKNRIAAEAYVAIAEAMPVGSVAAEPQTEPAVADNLADARPRREL
jgi:hypothetical protein